MRAMCVLLVILGALMQSAVCLGQGVPDVVGVETRFQLMDDSMETLLHRGYSVVNIAVGLAGFAYLLRSVDKWVTCAVQPDAGRPGTFVSECRSMS